MGTASSVPRMTRTVRGHSVHDPEARSGQGHKDRRVAGDRLVDALAPNESGPHQVTGVAPIEHRTRGTAQLAARSTRFEYHVVGERMAREDHSALLSAEHVAAEADGMGAPPTARALSQEVIETMRTHMTLKCVEHGDVVFVQLSVRHGPPPCRTVATTVKRCPSSEYANSEHPRDTVRQGETQGDTVEQELAPEKSSHQVGGRRLRPSGAVGATSSVRILSGESVRTLDSGSHQSRGVGW